MTQSMNTMHNRDQIRDMFSRVAPRYDLLNRLLSLGIDRHWRKRAAAMIRSGSAGRILDIATGTGDMALAAAQATADSVTVIGVDFCPAMVERAGRKIDASAFCSRIGLGVAACEALPFRNDTFDSATIAFGIRNVIDRGLGLREILRVLHPGGRVVILEFSTPRSRLFKSVYNFYFRRLLPAIGGIFSDSGAYRYLPDSVKVFHDQDSFCTLMRETGFENVGCSEHTFGIVTCYMGEKAITLS